VKIALSTEKTEMCETTDFKIKKEKRTGTLYFKILAERNSPISEVLRM
jgi:hypothetical protein